MIGDLESDKLNLTGQIEDKDQGKFYSTTCYWKINQLKKTLPLKDFSNTKSFLFWKFQLLWNSITIRVGFKIRRNVRFWNDFWDDCSKTLIALKQLNENIASLEEEKLSLQETVNSLNKDLNSVREGVFLETYLLENLCQPQIPTIIFLNQKYYMR